MKKLHLGATIILLLSFSILFAQVEIFDQSGSFTVPANIYLIRVECWGAGGGGGTSGPPGFGKGGGGGGAYATSTMAVSPGQTFSFTVGLGGEPMTSGGSTIFGNNVVVAVGGAGAFGSPGGEGGKASACEGDLAYNGGNGAVSGMSFGGGGGGSAFSNAAGGNGAGYIGGAGEGNGGNGGLQGNNPGATGFAPGGGGGGKSGGMSASGRGANGRVKISYGAALPVTWLSFRAEYQSPNVHLRWSTASESNNEGFDVQRSENGRDWQTLAFVPGAGTTSEVTNYQHTDNIQSLITNHYITASGKKTTTERLTIPPSGPSSSRAATTAA
jgi:hypothetical protein